MRKKRYDVVVVGCGPGGAVAGKFAALNGAETLIIEQKRQIGFPVYDTMGIVYSKSEMEETTGEMIEPATIYSAAEGLRYISPSGKEGKPQTLPDGIFVNRQLFEKSLAIGAARAGAEIMLHTRVVGVVKEGGWVKGVIIKNGSGVTTIPCSVVIAAEGSYQHIARQAGIDLPKGSVIFRLGCEFAGVSPLVGRHNMDEIYLDASGEATHGMVVPYAEDRYSLGSGVSRANAKQHKSLKQRLDDFVRHLETIGRYNFSRASPVSMISGGSVMRRQTPDRRLAADGIILVGDAAGRPLFGCRWGAPGMLGASWTGRVAGQMAARAVKKGDVSGKSLDQEYKDILGKTLKQGQRESVLKAHNAWSELFTLTAEEQERAVAEIGCEMAALHFYSKGGLAAPLPSCLERAQHWLKERAVQYRGSD